MSVEPDIERELDELSALACLHLEPAEKKQVARRLDELLKVLRRIQDIDTTGVEPVVHPVALPVRFREDEVEPSLSPEQVFGNTAGRSGQHFHVPRIAGDEPDEI